MDKIADRIFSFEGEGVVEDFQGGYTRYVNRKLKNPSSAKTSKEEVKAVIEEVPKEEFVKAPAKLNYHEKREFDQLMRQILKGEERKEQINVIFQTEQLSHEDLKELGKELQILAADLEEKEAKWMEMSERM